jgi:hypothetical protein
MAQRRMASPQAGMRNEEHPWTARRPRAQRPSWRPYGSRVSMATCSPRPNARPATHASALGRSRSAGPVGWRSAAKTASDREVLDLRPPVVDRRGVYRAHVVSGLLPGSQDQPRIEGVRFGVEEVHRARLGLVAARPTPAGSSQAWRPSLREVVVRSVRVDSTDAVFEAPIVGTAPASSRPNGRPTGPAWPTAERLSRRRSEPSVVHDGGSPT